MFVKIDVTLIRELDICRHSWVFGHNKAKGWGTKTRQNRRSSNVKLMVESLVYFERSYIYKFCKWSYLRVEDKSRTDILSVKCRSVEVTTAVLKLQYLLQFSMAFIDKIECCVDYSVLICCILSHCRLWGVNCLKCIFKILRQLCWRL